MRDFFSLKLPNSTPGKVIKAHRRNAKITLQELASKTEISRLIWSKIENDKKVLDRNIANIAGSALGLDPEIILSSQDEAASVPEISKNIRPKKN